MWSLLVMKYWFIVYLKSEVVLWPEFETTTLDTGQSNFSKVRFGLGVRRVLQELYSAVLVRLDFGAAELGRCRRRKPTTNPSSGAWVWAGNFFFIKRGPIWWEQACPRIKHSLLQKIISYFWGRLTKGTVFPRNVFSFGERAQGQSVPKPNLRYAFTPPSQNLSVHFSPLLWEISKKWPKQKNRIFRPRFVRNNDFWKILNFRPSFEFLKVCFWNSSQTKNIYHNFFSNYKRSHFSATFGTKTLKIEYQDFEIW
jgi:hypothetical protein